MKKKYGISDFLKSNWLWILLGIFFNFGFGYTKSVNAVYLQKITDILEKGWQNQLIYFVVIGGALSFLSFVLRWLGAIVPKYLTEKLAYETRINLFHHLCNIPFIWYEANQVGQLQSTIQNDSIQAGEILYIVISRIISNIFLFIFSVWIMAITNLQITVVAIIAVLAATAINQFILKGIKKYNIAAQQNLAEMTSSLEKTFSGIEIVKTAGAETYVIKDYQSKQNSYCENKFKSALIGALRTVWFGFTEHLCLYGSVLWLGILGINGDLTIGKVLMFIYLIKQIIMPIEMIFRWMEIIPDSIASSERISDIQKVQTEPKSIGTKVTADVKKIIYKNINYEYTGNAPVFIDFSLALVRGKIVGLTGNSGSGKTTLLKILSGVYRCDKMEIDIDGESVKEIDTNNVAYAALDRAVFPISIYENVVLGNSQILKTTVIHYFDKLGFSSWLNNFADGVDEIMNENSLSGGERQTITNIRALLSGREIIILDEPFSALDAMKEKYLISELQEVKKRKMILITSHRCTKTDLIDEIVSLD